MVYDKVKQPKISEVIAAKLEKMILDGILQPGEKLPPERALAEKFAVSRPSLREAIHKLESKGIVTRKQGGGTYIKKQLWETLADPILNLMQNDSESQYDLLEFRHATEGMMAYYAALRGTDTDLQNIRVQIESIEKSSSIQEQATAIVKFYQTIAEASHNVAMLHLVFSLAPVLLKNIISNLEILHNSKNAIPTVNEHRRALLDAIISRDPEGARIASNLHLSFIEDVMIKAIKDDSRMQLSLRRLKNN